MPRMGEERDGISRQRPEKELVMLWRNAGQNKGAS